MLTILFASFLVLLLIDMPIAFALGIATMITLATSETLPLNSLVTRAFVGVDSFTLLAIPFFIAAGEIMNACGITERIVTLSRAIVGHIRGGLAHVTIVSNMFFSGISGSATADASALGSMMIPAMRKNGFDADYAVAVNASASAMGPIIPPSIMMVIYGSIASVSISQLFMGGFVPGIMVGLGLMVMAYFIAKRRSYPAPDRAELPPIRPALRRATLALAMPVIILGGNLFRHLHRDRGRRCRCCVRTPGGNLCLQDAHIAEVGRSAGSVGDHDCFRNVPDRHGNLICLAARVGWFRQRGAVISVTYFLGTDRSCDAHTGLHSIAWPLHRRDPDPGDLYTGSVAGGRRSQCRPGLFRSRPGNGCGHRLRYGCTFPME